MVTTGAGEIAVVTGAVVAGQRDAGGDASVFAQLLGDAAASVPAAGATHGKGGSTRPVGNPTQTGAVPTVAASADMLALCGLPVTLPVPEVAMTDTAANVSVNESADGSANVSADPASIPQALAAGIDPAAVMMLPQSGALQTNSQVNGQVNARIETNATDVMPQDGDLAGASRAADLQWLNGGVAAHATGSAMLESTMDAGIQGQIKPATSSSPGLAALSGEQGVRQSVQQTAHQPDQQMTQRLSTQTMTDTGAVELPVLQDSTTVTPEQQAAFQKLLAQTTPMMGVMTAQLREAGVDEAARTTSSDMQNLLGAVHASTLQPAGTQLAGDVPVLEVSPRHHLHSPVGTQQWATELGNRLTMMATKDTQSATLYMTPADLGPVQVRIDLNQDQASVWFTAEHAETRSALEQSLPKLRELFTAQGMSLTDAGVFGDRSRQQQPESNFTTAGFHSTQYDDSEALADTATVRSISLGLLDAYA